VLRHRKLVVLISIAVVLILRRYVFAVWRSLGIFVVATASTAELQTRLIAITHV
jgi:hypothetical protein